MSFSYTWWYWLHGTWMVQRHQGNNLLNGKICRFSLPSNVQAPPPDRLLIYLLIYSSVCFLLYFILIWCFLIHCDHIFPFFMPQSGDDPCIRCLERWRQLSLSLTRTCNSPVVLTTILSLAQVAGKVALIFEMRESTSSQRPSVHFRYSKQPSVHCSYFKQPSVRSSYLKQHSVYCSYFKRPSVHCSYFE